MPDVDAYVAKYTPEQYLARERAAAAMKTTHTTPQAVLDELLATIARDRGLSTERVRDLLRHRNGLPGDVVFNTVAEEHVALTAFEDEVPDEVTALAALAEAGMATEEELAQFTDEAGTPWTDAMQQYGSDEATEIIQREMTHKAGLPAPSAPRYTNPPTRSAQVAAIARARTPLHDSEIARLTNPEMLDFTRQPTSTGPGQLTREQHAALDVDGIQLSQSRKVTSHTAEECDDMHCTDHDHQVARIGREFSNYINPNTINDAGNQHGLPHSPGAPGQRDHGSASSYGAPARKAMGTTRRRPSRAPSWTPGNAAVGEGGELSSGDGPGGEA